MLHFLSYLLLLENEISLGVPFQFDHLAPVFCRGIQQGGDNELWGLVLPRHQKHQSIPQT